MTNYPQIASRTTQGLFNYAACTVLFLVVYGSLVPFDYHAIPWDEAIQTFEGLPYYGLRLDSSADWVTNVLLFVPVSFLWLGVLWHMRPRRWPMLRSALVWVACVGLSLAIEFAQIYFPPRVPDFNDIVAQAIGAPIGIVLWLGFGPATVEWVATWRHIGDPPLISRRVLYLYLTILFAYGLFPLDLSISLTDLYHKWREGRIVLVPFGFQYADPTALVYGFTTDLALWVPVGILWGKFGKAGTRSIWIRAIGIAALLEFLQVFVMTRTADVTSVLAAAVGSGLGLVAVRRSAMTLAPAPLVDVQWDRMRNVFPIWIGVGLWLSVIVAVFWYPFQFDVHYEFAAQRWKSFSKVPFVAYAAGSEYRALTEFLHKTLFFAPLGVLLGIIGARILRWRGVYLVAALCFVVGVATAIEVGKIFLAGKILDTANWLLEVFGGWAGLWATIALYPVLTRTGPLFAARDALRTPGRMTAMPAMQSTPRGLPLRSKGEYANGATGRSKPSDLPGNQSALGVGIAAPIVMGLFVWWMSSIPQAPYNLQKLLHPSYPLLSAVMLCAVLLWTTAFPMWAVRQLERHRSYLVRYPLVTCMHAAIACLILCVCVEPIRIHKIVGSPIMGWAWEWETIGRFLALYSGISLCTVAGCLFAPIDARESRGQAWAIWLVTAVWALPIVYWVVVVEAATDNLVELLRDGASISAFLLVGLYLALISATGGRVASIVSRQADSILLTLALVFLSFPIGFWMLDSAAEPALFKYGQFFSGLQFILSSDRQHYATGYTLFLRFAVLHTGLLAAFTVGGWLGLLRPVPLRSPWRRRVWGPGSTL